MNQKKACHCTNVLFTLIFSTIYKYVSLLVYSHAGGLKRARLTKDEEKELKTYITQFKVLTPGSPQLLQVVQEARHILNHDAH